MIEAAWPWRRYQPGSALSGSFQEPLRRSNHFDGARGRSDAVLPGEFQNDSPPIVEPPEPPSFPDLSSRRETAKNVEAIDTAAPVRGFEFSADF